MSRVKNIQSTITMNDIAREAGVSIATVSRALNDEEGVGLKTRGKISEIVKRLNYHPNLQARALAAKKPNVLGIVIPHSTEIAFANPYYAEILKGVEETARNSGRYLLISFSGGDNYDNMYQHGLVAGIIVLGNRMDDPYIKECWVKGVPLVFSPGDPHQPGIPSVDMDNRAAAFLATDHLAGLGHRRIAFISGPKNSKYSVERLDGYIKALKKNCLPFQQDLIFESNATKENGYDCMRRLLLLPEMPTAVIVINDYATLGVLQAVKEMNYRVPEDISIIGFGDVPLASMTDPSLTTIREPFHKIGHELVNLLLNLIQGKKLSKRHLVLPVELVIRKSTSASSDLNRKII